MGLPTNDAEDATHGASKALQFCSVSSRELKRDGRAPGRVAVGVTIGRGSSSGAGCEA